MRFSKMYLQALSFLMLVISLNSVRAQAPCPFNGPGDSLTNTHPRPYVTGQWWRYNTWDWTRMSLAARNDISYLDYTDAYCLAGIPDSCPFCECGILNPYYATGQAAIANIVGTDFAQADGWELIKRDFGYLNSGANNANCSPTPYFIMYNRYSGKLRVIGALSEQGSHQIVDIKLHFADQSEWPYITWTNYRTTAIFANYGSYSKTLADSANGSLVYTTPAAYPGNDNEFFYGDFQMAYDPCTCKDTSALQVDFTLVDSMSVILQGDILGANIPVTDPELTALDPNHTWLSSVVKNPSTFSVNNGLQMYTTIDSLTSDYQSQLSAYTTSQTIKQIFSAIGGAFGALGGAVGQLPQIAGMVISAAAKDTAFKKVTTQIGGALKGVAPATSFLGSLLGGNVSAPVQPTALYAQAVFAGNIYESTDDNAYSIVIGNPGCAMGDTLPEVTTVSNPYPMYPQYNEILGVFALLQPPYVIRYNWTNQMNVTEAEDGGGYTNYTVNYNYRAYRLRYASDIQYVINPAAHPDLTNTIIQAAWEDQWSDPGYGSSFLIESYTPTNAQLFGLAENLMPVQAGNSTMDYISPFFDLAHFQNLYVAPPIATNSYNISNDTAVDFSSDDLYIKFNIVLVSTDVGSQGVPNGAMFTIRYRVPPDHIINQNISGAIYTQVDTEPGGIFTASDDGPFPINPLSEVYPTTSMSGFVTIPAITQNDTISTTTTLTSNISGYYNIYINANISSSTPVIISAANNIIVAPGVTVGPNITLTVLPYMGVPGGSAITPYSDISTFCGSNVYQANNALTVSRPRTTDSTQTATTTKPGISFNFDLFPNPAGNTCAARFSIPSSADVLLTLTDLTGRELATIDHSQHSQGTSVVPFNTSNFAAGLYLVRYSDGTNVATKKLTVSK